MRHNCISLVIIIFFISCLEHCVSERTGNESHDKSSPPTAVSFFARLMGRCYVVIRRSAFSLHESDSGLQCDTKHNRLTNHGAERPSAADAVHDGASGLAVSCQS
ncbi:uncharacterized protein BDW70DRAFT_35093 [Aspergillus foveolatus]|uniref:uncharacterized protein n=1 Tax=Aspergillus foveolatus TaxID=210207 RepID=UPI003CCE181E